MAGAVAGVPGIGMSMLVRTILQQWAVEGSELARRQRARNELIARIRATHPGMAASDRLSRLLDAALAARKRWGPSYRGAAIVEAARLLRCEVLLTDCRLHRREEFDAASLPNSLAHRGLIASDAPPAPRWPFAAEGASAVRTMCGYAASTGLGSRPVLRSFGSWL